MGEKETTREVNQLPICSFRFFVRPLVSPFCTDESGADRSKEEFMSVFMESKFMDFYADGLFRTFDRNGDGNLDMAEARVAARGYGAPKVVTFYA